MPHKNILVLANSAKINARCVAGREILSDGKQYSIGSWIRPLSGHGEGELNSLETQLTNGQQVRTMDFVEVPLERHVKDAFRPENWLISGPRSWARVNQKYQKPPLSILEEKPSELWLESGTANDRISHEGLQKRPPKQTLYVIRPDNLRIKLSTSWGKKRRRVLFTYNGVDYDLGLTDPVIDSHYCARVPAEHEPARLITLPCGNNPLTCISLTGNFKGYHYKVVATIFEES